jgi:hypothetical protein
MSCFAPVRGRVMRATRVDGCGRAICGPCSVVVSKGWVSVEHSPQVDDGEEINVVNAAGETCVLEPACPTMTGIEVTINFCQVDTDLFAMITGQDPLQNEAGENVGFDYGDIPCSTGFALETWLGINNPAGCDGASGGAEYGYQVLPWITSARLGDWTIENAAVTFSITATARSGHGWGRGPYDVQEYLDGTAGPLFTPIAPEKFGRLIKTTVAPPEAECGCQELTGCTTVVTSITAVPDDMDLVVTASEQIQVLGNEGDGGVQDVTADSTFASSAPLVATVDADGMVNAVGAGSATITVTYGAMVDTVTVTVT